MHAHHHECKSSSVLIWSLIATSAFVAIEVFAGVRSHSLALLSDAGHNATDALALLLAWFAVFCQRMPADESRTFGYHRAGVLAAFVNALTLVLLSVWILYESWIRLLHPAPVNDRVMLWVALGAVFLNGGVMLGIQRSGDKSVNLRGAYIHMLGDLLGAIGIIAGSLLSLSASWQVKSIASCCLCRRDTVSPNCRRDGSRLTTSAIIPIGSFSRSPRRPTSPPTSGAMSGT